MVIYGGQVVRSFAGEDITEQNLVAAMLGHVTSENTIEVKA